MKVLSILFYCNDALIKTEIRHGCQFLKHIERVNLLAVDNLHDIIIRVKISKEKNLIKIVHGSENSYSTNAARKYSKELFEDHHMRFTWFYVKAISQCYIGINIEFHLHKMTWEALHVDFIVVIIDEFSIIDTQN